MLSTQFNRDNQYQAITKPSLLAGCIALALLPSAAFAAPATEETVIVEGSATAPDDGENDYSVTSTSAGTKMQMTQRDIPQSVTIVSQQRMEDQQLQTLGEVMENTLGISKSQADSDRALYYSRGFQIDNYMVDGIPTYFESRWNLGDALSDMALFERVEVVRGATGLMTGTGNPSAAINMVRKHATSREFKGDVSAEYGSWNKERYVADLQSPLTEDGKIRARIVGGYQNNDSWLDRYNSEKTFFSGIVDADLGDLTTLSAGYEYQRIDVNSPTWGGLPRWNTDGSSNSYDRARSTAPDWAYNDTTHMKSLYAATRVTLADPLHLILGARYTNWRVDTLTYSMEKNHTTPYAGLVFDINDNWSTYASYTSIFQPQNDRDSSGKYLAPITGNNYELGLKSDWMNSRLTTTLAIFRIEQDNVAQSTGTPIPGSNGETAYKAVDGTVSKGVEFELNGAITDNWQLTFGATRYIAEDNEGNAVNPNLPRTTVKMFTSYRLPVMPELTVGGGVNWQNRVYTDTVTPYGTFRAEQGSYALVDLFTRYQVTKNFSLQGNVNNLFDKTYDTNVEGSIVYGTPRNFSITGTYQF
ncbi:TonB-dependent siderophore receptor [Escherichia coli]|nr:TonB-dependent siderophore receptor [Escherichia coli]EIY9408238.1 TonB-dependent siderophore receptor [Escherichia coli]